MNLYNHMAGPQNSGNPFSGCLEVHQVARLTGIQEAEISFGLHCKLVLYPLCVIVQNSEVSGIFTLLTS